jgi:hypothetical protein
MKSNECNTTQCDAIKVQSCKRGIFELGGKPKHFASTSWMNLEEAGED